MQTRLIRVSVLITLFLIPIFISSSVLGCNNPVDSTEVENVKNRIVESYIEGIFLKGDHKLLKKGWHPDCDIVILENGKLHKLPAQYWINRLKNNPKPIDTTVTYKFSEVKITGYAAVAVVEIFSKGKHLYTDYISLYKFGNDWKIVTKIFYTYPADTKSQ